MTDDLIPDPIKSYAPKQPSFKQSESKQQPDSIDAQTLATLQDMPRDALIALIKRVSGAMWGIGCMTEEQVADAMLLKLAHTALTSKDSRDTLAAIREWLDRVKGKAVQPVVGALKLSYEPLVIRGMLE